MKLKALVKSLSDVDESLRGLYVPIDPDNESEGFRLDVDDSDYKNKVNEFRKSNILLRQEKEKLEAMIKRFEGIDPESARKAQDALKRMEVEEERRLVEEGKLDEVINRRTSAMQKNAEQQREALNRKYQELEEKYKASRERNQRNDVEKQVSEAITRKKVRVRDSALYDVMARSHALFRYNDEGEIVAYNSDGTPVFGKSGKELTIDEHIESLVESAPHLFEPPEGGSSRGSGRTQVQNGVRRISASPDLIGQNLESIMKGETSVDMG